MLTSTPSATAAATIPAPLATGPKKTVWDKRLSDIFWVNSVAISNDGSRVVAATYLHDYRQKSGGLPNVRSRFGTYCFDGAPAKDGAPKDPLWSDEYPAWDGVFGVAISGDGRIAAASGFLNKSEDDVAQGLVRAYDAGDGTNLLDFTGVDKRVSWVSLSHDGKVLAAVADDVYVFLWDGASFNKTPLKLGIGAVAGGFVTNVAVHPDGTWLAACDKLGHVYVATIDASRRAFTSTITWKEATGEEFPFLSVAIASQANTFVVGGGNDAFLFDLADVLRKEHDPNLIQPLRYKTTADDEDPATIPPHKDPTKIQENVRWVAISANGNLLSIVANRRDAVSKKPTGVIMVLARQGNALTREWREFIDKNPNSTSIDANGQYVTLADGFPTIKPARFHLFQADGTKRWDFGTFSMNWPMVISKDGNAIVAGSDDGAVYYFTP